MFGHRSRREPGHNSWFQPSRVTSVPLTHKPVTFMTLVLDSFHCSQISHNSIQFYSAFRHLILSLIQNLPLIRIQNQYLSFWLLLLRLLIPILSSGASYWIILLSFCTINYKISSHLANPLETGHDPGQLTLMKTNIY